MAWAPPASDAVAWQPPATDAVNSPDQTPLVQPQSTWEAVKAALASRPELQPYGTPSVPNAPSGPVSGALNAATQTLAAPIRVGNTLSQGPDVVGEGSSNLGNQVGYPNTGAAIGTAIQMAPYVAGGVGAYQGLNAVENPVVKGLMNTPQELGPEYQALDQQAGVSQKLPVQRGTVAKFPGLDGTPQNQPPVEAPNVSPISYPKDRNTYLNFVRDRIDGTGQNLTPQELADHDKILSDIMTNMKAKGQSGTPVFQKAAQAGSDITDLRNANVPGRPGLNTAYGISKNSQAVQQAIAQYASKAARWGGPILGAGAALYDYLKK
jgi:hypothetical protein